MFEDETLAAAVLCHPGVPYRKRRRWLEECGAGGALDGAGVWACDDAAMVALCQELGALRQRLEALGYGAYDRGVAVAAFAMGWARRGALRAEG
jgi:hypothetical protein